MVMERVKQKLPTLAMASQNMAVAATLLDMLPTPSTGGVGEVH
jgi:hypothetical protein